MKKQYIIPQTETRVLNDIEMICTSIPIGGSAVDFNVTDADSRLTSPFEEIGLGMD